MTHSTSSARHAGRAPALLDSAGFRAAVIGSFTKLAPQHAFQNPVMAVVWLGTLLAAGLTLAGTTTPGIGGSATLTRLRADLSPSALDRDLQLMASDLGVRSRSYEYGTILNQPSCLGDDDDAVVDAEALGHPPVGELAEAALERGGERPLEDLLSAVARTHALDRSGRYE